VGIVNATKKLSNLPWLVMGDFNEAMWAFEHFSTTCRGEQQMANFREALNVCELTDLGFTGTPYTYSNKREGRQNVKVHLDRAVADNAWRDIFGEAQLKHLVSCRSDHFPVLLQFEQEVRVLRKTDQQDMKSCGSETKPFQMSYKRLGCTLHVVEIWVRLL